MACGCKIPRQTGVGAAGHRIFGQACSTLHQQATDFTDLFMLARGQTAKGITPETPACLIRRCKSLTLGCSASTASALTIGTSSQRIPISTTVGLCVRSTTHRRLRRYRSAHPAMASGWQLARQRRVRPSRSISTVNVTDAALLARPRPAYGLASRASSSACAVPSVG